MSKKLSMSDVTSITPYSWDGTSRPELSNYISPWASAASTVYPKFITKKNKDMYSAIDYAKTQLEAANAQYEDDLAYWQEMNERSYTTPIAQSSRYEEAGYNMGYMYGSVDSGNSAVGFDNPNSSITPYNSQDPTLQNVKAVADVVSQAVGVVTGLVKSGIDISKVGLEIDSLRNNNEAVKLANDWQNILRSTDFNGNKVSDVTKSLAFSLQALGYKQGDQQLQIGSKELTRLDSFLKYCDKIYDNQSTNPSAEIVKGISGFVNNMDFSWAGQYQNLAKKIAQLLGFISAMKINSKVGN